MTETPAPITDEQRSFAADVLHSLPFSRLLGMKLIDLQRGVAVLSIDMRDDLKQPNGILHGGVTASLIDTAMAFAVRTYLTPTEPTATIDLTVHYLRPHISGPITCTANVVRAGKRIFTVSADVLNDTGQHIATAVSTYTRL